MKKSYFGCKHCGEHESCDCDLYDFIHCSDCSKKWEEKEYIVEVEANG